MAGEKSRNDGLKKHKHVIYIKNVGLRPLYNMNNIYYKEVKKWEKREWRKYNNLRDNESMDSFLLNDQTLAFITNRNRRRNIYRRRKGYSFLPLFRIFGLFGLLTPIQASPW